MYPGLGVYLLLQLMKDRMKNNYIKESKMEDSKKLVQELKTINEGIKMEELKKLEREWKAVCDSMSKWLTFKNDFVTAQSFGVLIDKYKSSHLSEIIILSNNKVYKYDGDSCTCCVESKNSCYNCPINNYSESCTNSGAPWRELKNLMISINDNNKEVFIKITDELIDAITNVYKNLENVKGIIEEKIKKINDKPSYFDKVSFMEWAKDKRIGLSFWNKNNYIEEIAFPNKFILTGVFYAKYNIDLLLREYYYNKDQEWIEYKDK